MNSRLNQLTYLLKRNIHTNQDTLVLLHVIFRHGDRTPDLSSTYPKDPHIHNDYSPYGHGQLTNAGKIRAYELGQFLRKKYDKFLGDIYKVDYVDAWASAFDRTKMTLQLVLAALYPPKNHQVWHDRIPWQPIPFNSTPKEYDKIFLAFLYNRKALEDYEKETREMGRELLEPYRSVIEFIEENSGLRIENPRTMFAIACTLGTQQAMGFNLPNWTKDVWPHYIEEIAMKEFDILNSNTPLKSLIIGKLFDKIVEDTKFKINGRSNCKIHLYSGHDYTVGMFLKALNIFELHHPDFCSNVIIEVHKVNDDYRLKILYQPTQKEQHRNMILPGCEPIVTLDQFKENVCDILLDRSFEKH